MQARLSYEDFKFAVPAEDSPEVICEFMGHYYFALQKSDLSEIAQFHIETDGSIVFECSEKRAEQKLTNVIEKGLANLTNRIRNKKTIYIHSNSGIPLIGANDFGLVDRGTNIIEVKPSTGCNLSCAFCSVSEGENDFNDILVDDEYLIEEFRKLSSIKKHPVEACINPHGEPLLYPKLIKLISGLKATPNVDIISINSNGCMLSKKVIDEFYAAGLTRINISLHSLNQEKASKLANAPYNVGKVLEMIKYCEGKIDVLLAPVVVPGMNEEDIGDIVALSKTIKNKRFPSIGIQNFLNYKGGRNVAEEMPWEKFYELLRNEEIKHNTKLIIEENLFNIQYDETLPKPFKKGQIIKAEIKSPGRKRNEYICSAGERNITVIKPKKISGTVSVKLLRDKHNIYTAISA